MQVPVCEAYNVSSNLYFVQTLTSESDAVLPIHFILLQEKVNYIEYLQ